MDTLPLTRIVATVGPACAVPAALARLVETGVAVFRLNLSHGTLDEHGAWVRGIRAAAAGRPVAILADLPGPKIRLENVPPGGVEVETGATAVFVRGGAASAGARDLRFACTYAGLVDDVAPGERILIDDGTVRMLVVETRGAEVSCTVTHGGRVMPRKGVNLPDTDLHLATPTDGDWRLVEWAIAHEADFVALSFVRRAEEVRALRSGIAARTAGDPPGRAPSIVAKIETPRAIEDADRIAEAADAIMVARGDLGVEMDAAQVPVIQKRLIAASHDRGIPCIVATQMLESMIAAPAPTRAEASDVAGAIFDEADAIMLSGETAIGRYPVLAVEQVRRIAGYTEAYLASRPADASPPARPRESGHPTAALAHGAWTIAQDVRARCIVAWSQAGGGARYLSQNSFRVPIVAATSDERAARRMQLYRGVIPVVMAAPRDVPSFVRSIDRLVRDRGLARAGDTCLMLVGEPLGRARATDCVMLHVVGREA